MKILQIQDKEICSLTSKFLIFEFREGQKHFAINLNTIEQHYQFCSNIGGRVAVLGSDSNLNKMKAAVQDLYSIGFLSGYCGNDKNVWLNINDDTPIPESLKGKIQFDGKTTTEGKCLYYMTSGDTKDELMSIEVNVGLPPFCEIQNSVFIMR